MNDRFLEILKQLMIKENGLSNTLIAQKIFPKARQPLNEIKIPRKTIEEMPFWMAWQTRALERYLRNRIQLSERDYLRLVTRLIYRRIQPGLPIDFESVLMEIDKPLVTYNFEFKHIEKLR